MIIRQSDLKLWATCPERFRLTKAGAKREQSGALTFGTIIHACIEVLETEGLTQALDFFDIWWDDPTILSPDLAIDYYVRGTDWAKYRKSGRKILRDYASIYQWDSDAVIGRELSFDVPIGDGHILHGTIDKLVVRQTPDGPALVVVDFKTSRKEPTYGTLAEDLQFTSYCASPDTPILLADGITWKELGDIHVGDEVMGFDEFTSSSRRRWEKAVVQASWRTTRWAYRITFTDGRSVTCSGDHRWLAKPMSRAAQFAKRYGNDGWVMTRDLREGDLLSAIPVASCDVTDEYMWGYIAGANLGDGTCRLTKVGEQHRKPSYWQISSPIFDVAVIDRLESFFRHLGFEAHRHSIAPNTHPKGTSFAGTVPMVGLRTSRRSQVQAIMDGSRWRETDDFLKGWMAGLFDTDGSLHKVSQTISYHQKDLAVLETIKKVAARFGFTFVDARGSDCPAVRLAGDRLQRLKFGMTVRPALQRKIESLEGRTVRIFEAAQIESIESVGEMELCDITTSTSTFVANGILSHNCYATMQDAFWAFNPKMGKRLKRLPRRGEWVQLLVPRRKDVGPRTEQQFNRLIRAVNELARSVEANIYVPTISGDACTWCDFRKQCGLPEAP